jgi:hypothetical protein
MTMQHWHSRNQKTGKTHYGRIIYGDTKIATQYTLLHLTEGGSDRPCKQCAQVAKEQGGK